MDARAEQRDLLAQLQAELERRTHDARLNAAHAAELIPVGEKASSGVRQALAAACEEGRALGLSDAVAAFADARATCGEDTNRVRRSCDPWRPPRLSGTAVPQADGLGMAQFPDNGALGSAAHAVIASLLERGSGAPAAAELMREAAQHPRAQRGTITHRMMVRSRLTAAASAYFFEHGPQPDWTFLGAEVQLGGVRVDLLWLTPHGYLIDELKTGWLSDPADPAVADQLTRLITAGRAAYGTEFHGVRLLRLSRPLPPLFIPANTETTEDERNNR